MEINDFKDIWKDSFSESEGKLSPREIEERLKIKSKTKSLMSKVKRSFHFEFFVSIIVIIFLLVKFVPKINSVKESIALSIFILLYLVLILFVWRKYKKISNINILQDQLKPAIIQWIKILEKYVNFNTSKFAKYILIPFAIILSFALGIFIGADEADVIEKLSKLGNGKLLISIALLVGLYILVIPLSKWSTNKMYSRHLEEMKQCLADLEEIDESNES